MPFLGFCAALPVMMRHRDDCTTPPLLTTPTIFLLVITAIQAIDTNARITPMSSASSLEPPEVVALQSSSGLSETAQKVR